MKKILFLCLCFPLLLQAQIKGDYTWLLGYDAGWVTPDDDIGEGIILDFNQNPTRFEYFPKEDLAPFYWTSAMISDEEGELQFYSNGCRVMNANHQIMENGNGINPGFVHDDQCVNIGRGYPVAQGAIVIPKPNNEKVYYMLHQKLEVLYDTPGFPVAVDGLYYTTIDMNLNNGLGGVVEKNIAAFSDTLDYSLLTVTKHDNNICLLYTSPSPRD